MDRLTNNYIASEATARNTREFTFRASAAATANGNTNGFDVSNYGEALVFINVTAVSGTSPTLNLYVDTYDFLSGQWFQHPVSIAQITAAGNTLVQLTNFGEQIRLRWQVGGTSPSFTFSASVVAKS